MQFSEKKHGVSISIQKVENEDDKIIEHLIKDISIKTISFDSVDQNTYEIIKDEHPFSENSIKDSLNLFAHKEHSLLNFYKGNKPLPFLSYQTNKSLSSLSLSESKTTILNWIDKVNSEIILQNLNLKSLSFSSTTNDFNLSKPDDTVYWKLIKEGKKDGFQGIQKELSFNIEWFSVIPSFLDEGLRGYYTFRDENNKLLPSAKFISSNPFTSDDILLKIPAYRVERLPGGGTLVQLTKEINVYEKDPDYIEAWFKAYEYLKSQIQNNY